MAKGVLLITIAVCLVASSYPQPLVDLGALLSPVTGALQTVTGAVGDVASGLTNALGGVTNALGGVTDSLSGVLKGVLDTVLKLVETLLKVVIELLKVILKVLESLLKVPLQAVNQLLDALGGLLKPSNIKDGVKSALEAQIAAAKELARQLAGTAAVTQCLVNQVSANISTAILKSTVEIISCANPKLKDVNEAASLVGKVVGSNGEFVRKAIEEATKCAQANANSADPSKLLACLVDPVTKGIVEATLLVNATSPIINDALGNALGISACANKVLNKEISKANGLLEGVVKCAAKLGINASLPKLPGGVPNFTAVAERALSTIQDLSSAAVGPQSPINDLTAAIKKLQESVASTSPLAVGASLNKSIAGVQAALDSIKVNPNVTGSADPSVASCILNAQNSLNRFPQQGLQFFLQCAPSVANDAAELVEETAELDVELKTLSLKAGVNAFAKCSQFALAVDNAAGNCLDAAVNEVRSLFNAQQKKINSAITEANGLINKTVGCLQLLQTTADFEGQKLINFTKACLASKGVVIASEDLQTEIVSGENQIFKVVANLSVAVQAVSADNENINGSVDFIKSIDAELLSSVISPTVLTGKIAVAEVRELLKNNNNPAVAACLNASEANVAKVDAAVLASAQACVEGNLTVAKSVANASAADLASLKKKLDNAAADAVAQCSKSVSAAAAKNCFANVNQTLNSDVKNAQLRSANSAEQAQLLLNQAVVCANSASNDAAVKVDAELASLKSCLAAQGVTITVTRS